MRLLAVLTTSLLISVLSGTARADCFNCQCISRQSDGSPLVTAEVRVQLESECSAKCSFNSGTCDNTGVCHPNLPQKAYRLTRLIDDQCIGCGSYWTKWRDIGSSGLDPCPPGCKRTPKTGSQTDSAYRNIVRYSPLGLPVVVHQEKNKFTCYGTATGPAPVETDEPVIPPKAPFVVSTPVLVPEPRTPILRPPPPPPPPRPEDVRQEVKKRLGF